VNGLSRLWERLNRSKRYRESFVASVVKRMLPLQIKVLRKQRGWSQAELAKQSKLTQGVVSRAEDPDYGNLTINTLVRIAAGFDCAFVGRFVRFSDLADWYTRLSDEKSLEIESFEKESTESSRKPASSEQLLVTTWRVPSMAQTHQEIGMYFASIPPKVDTWSRATFHAGEPSAKVVALRASPIFGRSLLSLKVANE